MKSTGALLSLPELVKLYSVKGEALPNPEKSLVKPAAPTYCNVVIGMIFRGRKNQWQSPLRQIKQFQEKGIKPLQKTQSNPEIHFKVKFI
jgi:hypothetical protein